MGQGSQLLATLSFTILAQRIDNDRLFCGMDNLHGLCLGLRLNSNGNILACVPVDVMLLQILSCGKDDFVVLAYLVTFRIIVGHIDQPLLILHALLVGINNLLHELLTLLAQGELSLDLRVADHQVTVPMATAHIAAITPAACIGHLTHLADADKRIGLTGERHLMIAAFLRELIGQLFGLGHVLGGLVERCLNLFLQGIQLRFQPLQVIFLSPRLSSNTLILGNVLCQFRIAFLILGNDTGNTLQCLYAIAHSPQAVVLAHGQMTVVMLIEVMAFHIEGVASIYLLLHLLVVHINRIDNQWEAIDLTHLTVFVTDGSPCILQGSTHPFYVIGTISCKLLDLGHSQTWQGSAVLAIFGSGLEFIIVLSHILDNDIVLLYLLLSDLQAPLGFPSGLHVGLTLRLQGHDLLLQLGLLKQVVIAGEDGHILGEVHAVLFIHRSLVDDTRAKAVGLQLGDEELLVLKQVELITIEGTLHSVDDDIYIVIGVELGNLVT